MVVWARETANVRIALDLARSMTFDDVTATLTAALVGSVHRQHVTIHTYFRYNSDRYRYTECVEPQNVTALGCMASARFPFTPPPPRLGSSSGREAITRAARAARPPMRTVHRAAHLGPQARTRDAKGAHTLHSTHNGRAVYRESNRARSKYPHQLVVCSLQLERSRTLACPLHDGRGWSRLHKRYRERGAGRINPGALATHLKPPSSGGTPSSPCSCRCPDRTCRGRSRRGNRRGSTRTRSSGHRRGRYTPEGSRTGRSRPS